MHQLETRFNHQFGYPYVFLNDVPFSDEFKSRISSATNSSVEFGVIPHDDWNQPSWINEEKAAKARASLKHGNVKYGDSVPYRNMCRFNSGFFYRHELLQKYRWYWRVEPGVQFHCNIPVDPFLFMEENDKMFSFTITALEIRPTIVTLWWHVKQFMQQHPEFIAQDNAIRFISPDNGISYNYCHFWSNFEIADMNFWRGPAYTAFFDYLDKAGGFYYERWGDAPIHSIAVSLFARKDQIHFFNDIGYQHDDWMHCPSSEEVYKANECSCDPSRSFDYQPGSCTSEWDRVFD
ncbi:glycosyltransferase family 15 protein [Pluteus cervinus]|uniref:Glycosyltransferase family 15 protein n=1 Tax=Pluteus cervinus TaxID=181527 RepID=A0ACD3AJC5_9AGAR|nr:glycosyltransferase family 15 protein [Pluteus cervinus]